MPIYTVFNPDGLRLGSVYADVATDLPEAIAELAPGHLYDLDPLDRTGLTVRVRPAGVPLGPATVASNAPTGALAVPIPPDPDPLIPSNQLHYQHRRIAGESWTLIDQHRATMSRMRRRIFLESAPVKSFRPGETPGVRAFNNWRRNPGVWKIDRERRFLIDTTTQTCWIFGLWRESYRAAIEQALGHVEFQPLGDPEFATLGRLIERAQNSGLEEHRRRFEAAVASIENYQRQLVREIRNRDAAHRLLESAKPADPELARKMAARILRVDGVEGLTVSGNQLHVLTKPIFVEVGPSRPGILPVISAKTRYDIGKFKVTIDLVSGSLTFMNLTRNVNGFQHPHVRSASPNAACLGEITANVPELMAKLAIPELVTMLIIYLRSTNIEDTIGRTIVNWPLAAEQPAPPAPAAPAIPIPDFGAPPPATTPRPALADALAAVTQDRGRPDPDELPF